MSIRRIPSPPAPIAYEGHPTEPIALQGDDNYLSELLHMLEPREVMEKHGYVMKPLTDAQLNQKRRCCNCNLTVAQLTTNLQKTLLYRLQNPVPPPPLIVYKPLPTIQIPLTGGLVETQSCTVPCKHHPGTVNKRTKRWFCCGQHVSEGKTCAISQVHRLREYAPGQVQRLYQLFPTPPVYSEEKENRPIREAVSIDCEMGTAVTGEPELIRLSAIDYFTGEVLVNNLVDPDQPLQHLNTRYSGVTWDQMKYALRNRTTLHGKLGARDALWRFVGPNTILVGHGVNNDLRALRWIHPRVVDSYMVEHKIVQAKKAAEAIAKEEAAAAAALRDATEQMQQLSASANNNNTELVLPPPHEETIATVEAAPPPKKKKPKGTGDLALKTLLKKYLEIDIQMQGKKGRDSLEDAIAARDLVHWMVMRSLGETTV